MPTIAGHSFERGRCACGRTEADICSIVHEFRSDNKTAVDENGIAHVGRVTSNEWNEMCNFVDERDKAYDAAFAQVCRA